MTAAGRGVLAALLLVGLGVSEGWAQRPGDPGDQERRLDALLQERVLRDIGAEIKDAVIRRDPSAIGKYLHGPLLCAKRQIPPEKVLRDLDTPGTETHAYFFDPRLYRQKFGQAKGRLMPLREFLDRARDLRVHAFVKDVTYGGISFQSSISEVSPFFDFVYHDGIGWRFAGNGFPGCDD